VLSVVPNGKGIATVRFIKHIKRVNQEGEGEIQHWVATISYEYRNPSKMKESLRLQNPFGFQVLSYRVDPELVGDKI
jgi:type IV secretion system protein VirB8